MEVLIESSTNHIVSERSRTGLSKNETTRLMRCSKRKWPSFSCACQRVATKTKMLCISRAFKLESCNVVHIMTGILCMIVWLILLFCHIVLRWQQCKVYITAIKHIYHTTLHILQSLLQLSNFNVLGPVAQRPDSTIQRVAIFHLFQKLAKSCWITDLDP